jgi:uncharacterized protein DUF6894
MRYLFHVISDKSCYFDDIGQHFGSPGQAEAHAVTIATELAADDYRGFEVRVVDGCGRELSRVPIM